MELYRSLVYRELKLTWKHYLLFLVLYILLVSLITIPFVMASKEQLFKTIGLEHVILKMFAMIQAILAAVISGSTNNVQKMDVDSGWKRYSYSLPVTAGEKAMSDLIVKLMFFILFGLLASVSALIIGSRSGYGIFCFMLNIYLIMSSAFWIVDAIENGSIVLGLNSAASKIVSVITGLMVLFLFVVRVKARNGSGREYSIFDLAEHRASLIFTLLFFAFVCFGYYRTMRKVYERREA